MRKYVHLLEGIACCDSCYRRKSCKNYGYLFVCAHFTQRTNQVVEESAISMIPIGLLEYLEKEMVSPIVVSSEDALAHTALCYTFLVTAFCHHKYAPTEEERLEGLYIMAIICMHAVGLKTLTPEDMESITFFPGVDSLEYFISIMPPLLKDPQRLRPNNPPSRQWAHDFIWRACLYEVVAKIIGY